MRDEKTTKKPPCPTCGGEGECGDGYPGRVDLTCSACGGSGDAAPPPGAVAEHVPDCDPTCPGWSTFDTPRGVELQRCDECNRYADDSGAAVAAWEAFCALMAGRIGEDPEGALRGLVDILTERVQESPDPDAEALAENLRDCFQALALAVHPEGEKVSS